MIDDIYIKITIRLMTGTKLRTWRARVGLLQEDAAKQAGVAQSKWSGLENGKRWPSIDEALRIEKMTGGEIVVAEWKRPERRKRSRRASGKRITKKAA